MPLSFGLNCKLLCVLCLWVSSLLHLNAHASNIAHVNDGLVKVIVNSETANINYPWSNGSLSGSSGSGFIVEYKGEKVILTNAHVIEGAVTMRVQKPEDDTEYNASIEYVSNHRDLAMIKPTDPNFFSGTRALQLSSREQAISVGDNVLTLGYPIGSKTQTITKGIISSIDYSIYSFSRVDNIVYVVDAAINSGKSGGPAVNSDGAVVGVSFQSIENAQNIGYIIPSSVVYQFFDDVDLSTGTKPDVQGVPSISVTATHLQNKQLRNIVKINHDETGILVTAVSGLEKEKGLLKVKDVILSIDGKAIDNQGNINTAQYKNISWRSLISSKQIGDHVELGIKRDGEYHSLNYPLTHNYSDSLLIAPNDGKRYINYLVVGGMVMIELSQDIYQTFEPYNFDHINVFSKTMRRTNSSVEDRIVIISNVLYSPVNSHYESLRYCILKDVNGTKIKNLNQLKALIASYRENNADLLFGCKSISGYHHVMGFSWDDLDTERPAIMSEYGVLHDVF